jgi:hypothetical protein
MEKDPEPAPAGCGRFALHPDLIGDRIPGYRHPAPTELPDPLYIFLDGRGALGREGFRGGRAGILSAGLIRKATPYGRLLPFPVRFPSAHNPKKSKATHIHINITSAYPLFW